MIRKARKEDYYGRPVLFMEIDGVPGHALDEQRHLASGVAIISGRAAGLFAPIQIPRPEGGATIISRGGTDDPEIVRLVWDFVLSNAAEADRGLLAKPPPAVLAVDIDRKWFEG